ncbi:MAG: DNA-binding protein [Candidatus Diapherotrites archaeon]|nr:DNA-binding protein [Candidatus Diapherotrites archaeon]
MNVKDLKPRAAVDEIILTIVSKAEPREFATEKASGKVCNCAGKDDTGEVKLTLWNEQIDAVNEGDKIKIQNGWVTEFRGEKQLGTGRNGTIEVIH